MAEVTQITSTSTQEEIFANHKVSLKDVNISAWNTLDRYTLDSYLVSDRFQDRCFKCTCTNVDGVEECIFSEEGKQVVYDDCCDGFYNFVEK